MTRVVIVHDYLTQRGGAERVVLALLSAFPGARLVTSLYDPCRTFPDFRRYDVETILPNARPFRRRPRLAFPVLAAAFSGHTIADADIVVCSTSGWAHGISTQATKVVYCHTPARWLYEPQDYFSGTMAGAEAAFRTVAKCWRRWDQRAALSAKVYIANSTVVRDRIRRVYGLVAEIIHPPATIDPHGEVAPVRLPFANYLLSIGRSRGYKHLELIERAANELGVPLVIVGAEAKPSRTAVMRLGQVSDAQLRWLYANCRALVAASHEDFGLTPVEAMMFGKPVVALQAGGYLDTVVDGETGLFFASPTCDAIVTALQRLPTVEFDPARIRTHAQRFTYPRFAAAIRHVVQRSL